MFTYYTEERRGDHRRDPDRGGARRGRQHRRGRSPSSAAANADHPRHHAHRARHPAQRRRGGAAHAEPVTGASDGSTARPAGSPARPRRGGHRHDHGHGVHHRAGLLVTAALGYALQAQPQARRDQDWNAALAAAQSGVDDYVARLNQNDKYWQTVDCTNPALKGPKAGTNTCGWTTSTAVGWQNVVAGRRHAGRSSTTTWTQRDLQPGRRPRHLDRQGAQRRTRTIQVLVVARRLDRIPLLHRLRGRRPGEHDGVPQRCADDVLRQGRPDHREVLLARAGVAVGRASRSPSSSGDTLDGQVHFNDTPLISGRPKFLKGYETSDPACKTATPATTTPTCWRGIGGSPNFNGNRRAYAGPLYLPDNSTSFATYPGCQYTGDTRIKFNADGTMTVWSKKSAGTTVGTGCGTPTTLRHRGLADRPGAQRPGHLRQERQHAGQVHDRSDRRRHPARRRRQRQPVDVLLRQRQRLHRGHPQGSGHGGRAEQRHRHRRPAAGRPPRPARAPTGTDMLGSGRGQLGRQLPPGRLVAGTT